MSASSTSGRWDYVPGSDLAGDSCRCPALNFDRHGQPSNQTLFPHGSAHGFVGGIKEISTFSNELLL